MARAVIAGPRDSRSNQSMNRSIGVLFQALDTPSSVLGAVFVGAFLETTILPIPFELLLVPLMLRFREMVWLIVFAALAGCMAGAYAGYVVGVFAFQTLGQAVLQGLGAEQAMDAFTARLNANGFWSIFLVGFTPVPVQVATLGAGVTALSIGTFTLAMVLSRGLRYGGLGTLVHFFGEGTQRLLRRYNRQALAVGMLLLVIVLYLLFWPDNANPGSS